jgi:hypothetical protein
MKANPWCTAWMENFMRSWPAGITAGEAARRARPGEHRSASSRAIGRRLRDWDLEIALREARADIGGGRVVHESVDDHLKHLDAWASARLP